jgi:hypothetical protein
MLQAVNFPDQEDTDPEFTLRHQVWVALYQVANVCQAFSTTTQALTWMPYVVPALQAVVLALRQLGFLV